MKSLINNIKNNIGWFITTIILMIIISLSAFFSSCNSSKRLTIYKESKIENCNRFFSMMDFNIKLDIKDTALVLKLMDKCFDEEKKYIKNKKTIDLEKRKKFCKKWIYINSNSKNSYQLQLYYNECVDYDNKI